MWKSQSSDFFQKKEKNLPRSHSCHPYKQLHPRRRMLSCAFIQFGQKFFLAKESTCDSLLVQLRIMVRFTTQILFTSVLNFSFFLDKNSNQTLAPPIYPETVICVLFRFTLNGFLLGPFLHSYQGTPHLPARCICIKIKLQMLLERIIPPQTIAISGHLFSDQIFDEKQKFLSKWIT